MWKEGNSCMDSIIFWRKLSQDLPYTLLFKEFILVRMFNSCIFQKFTYPSYYMQYHGYWWWLIELWFKEWRQIITLLLFNLTNKLLAKIAMIYQKIKEKHIIKNKWINNRLKYLQNSKTSIKIGKIRQMEVLFDNFD